ncbi:ABC transporter permease [Aliagarivorans taiwanensis]|uniref:ABC transporter permease n=1 Tax=Aliagarivorans taiwanensis TaxID=561966 RepID=UPI0003F7E589|nr:ABC transporter permease [Aliagarivorans taiwanensis]
MIASIPFKARDLKLYKLYIGLFLLFLLLPLVVVVVFSFNDSLFPALPWQGFSWTWYFGDSQPKLGLLHDSRMLRSIVNSFWVACGVTVLSLLMATINALLFVRFEFKGKGLLYMLMQLPLVIPGVILGVSILVASSQLANGLEEAIGWDWPWLRPGLVLVVFGQASFISAICSLILIARYRRFDRSLEEAALNLGANNWVAFSTVTLPYLRPTMISAGIVSFLMSFENFNTTLMLVGSDSPLTITMYERLREGSTPVINAVSVCLMVFSATLALVYLGFRKDAQD